MNKELENEINSIIKFGSAMFNPADVRVLSRGNPERYHIIFYFTDIDDRFISNPYSNDKEKLKKAMFAREIKKYVHNFLGIVTSGLQPPHYYSPGEEHPITIHVDYI